MLAVGLGCDSNFRISGTGQFVIELENVEGTNENQGSQSVLFILWSREKLVLNSGAAAVRTHKCIAVYDRSGESKGTRF